MARDATLVAHPPETHRASRATRHASGHIREVTNGTVACPLQGTAVTIGECLGCHCLVTHAGERDPLTDCALPELS
jgi:hypothetical protein